VSAELVGLVIYDSKMYNPGGTVRRWAERVEKKFTLNAIAEAPDGADSGRVNKTSANSMYPVGSMKRNITGEVRRVAPRHLQTTVSVNVPYALHVLKGTGTIYAKPQNRIPAGQPGGGQFAEGRVGMVLPPNLGFKAGVRVKSVSGQRANPFLDRAFVRTARSHPSLRGHIM
jgi:hypothetical protein